MKRWQIDRLAGTMQWWRHQATTTRFTVVTDGSITSRRSSDDLAVCMYLRSRPPSLFIPPGRWGQTGGKYRHLRFIERKCSRRIAHIARTYRRISAEFMSPTLHPYNRDTIRNKNAVLSQGEPRDVAVNFDSMEFISRPRAYAANSSSK